MTEIEKKQRLAAMLPSIMLGGPWLRTMRDFLGLTAENDSGTEIDDDHVVVLPALCRSSYEDLAAKIAEAAVTQAVENYWEAAPRKEEKTKSWSEHRVFMGVLNEVVVATAPLGSRESGVRGLFYTAGNWCGPDRRGVLKPMPDSFRFNPEVWKGLREDLRMLPEVAKFAPSLPN